MAKVMIVDDALFMRKILRDILTQEGHEVVAEAENGKEALSLYRKHKPDLVTMDIIMPEVEGLDGIKAVKEILKADPTAKIIMVSAMGQQDLVIEAIQAGAKDFIVKPFQAGNITDSVQRILQQKSAVA
jgi:two-component system chemotaxis response regulator CheY